MKRKVFALAIAGTLAITCFSGCSLLPGQEGQKESSSEKGEKQDIAITLWGAEDDQEMLSGMVESFKKMCIRDRMYTVRRVLQAFAKRKKSL